MVQIERPKLAGGPAKHHGVLCRNVYFSGDEFVANFDPKGVTIQSLEEWAAGRPWTVVGIVPDDQIPQATERLRNALAQRLIYDLILNNCEHVATWIVKGQLRSTQVGHAIVLGIFAVGLIYLLNSD